MVDIGVPDTEDLASTDKSILVDIVRREMEAAGKNRQTMSDEELEKEVQAVAERVGTKISAKDFGPRFAVKRDPEQGITFEREKDFTLGEQVRGKRIEPPDAFFQNVPEAMAEAIGKVNQQIITQPQPQERTFPKPQMKPSQEVTVQDAADQVRDTAESKGLSSIGEGVRLAAEQDIPPDVDAIEGQRIFNKQMERLRKKEDRVEAQENKANDFTSFTNEVLSITASAEDEASLTRNGRNALKRLSRRLQDNIRMGKPLDAIQLERLAEDVRYKEAFDILEGMSDGSIPITVGGTIDAALDGLQATSEVMMGVPVLGPGAKFTRLGVLGAKAARRTAASEAAKITAKRRQGADFALKEQRSGQDTMGVITTTKEGGKTVGVVKIRKFIGKSDVDEATALRGGLERVGRGGRKESGAFRLAGKEKEGTLAERNIPTRKAMTGKNKLTGLIIPIPGMSDDEIKDIEEVQTDTLNYIASRENFRATPYSDGEGQSIGLGTPALEGDEKITEQQAFERAQQFLEEQVYPEIETIQNEAGIILNKNQITALSSLLYNIGVGQTWNNSEAKRLLIEGDIEGFKEAAFDAEEGFVYSGGKLMRGLQNRRGKDLAMFNKAVPKRKPRVPIDT